MYDGNPGEIDFGLSYREVRVSEGSSYRESTVIINFIQPKDTKYVNHYLQMFEQWKFS